jgi:hypothetical protein
MDTESDHKGELLMSSILTPQQSLTIWRLLITGDEPLKSKLRNPERSVLLKQGFIALEKRGRSEHIVLTEKAWGWASENFDVQLSKSNTATLVLQELLKMTGRYLKNNRLALSDFTLATPKMVDVHSRICQGYLALSGGEFNKRVRLAHLKQHLSDLSKQEIEEGLLQFRLDGKVALMHLDDPLDIQPEDEEAAILSGGQLNHILYMKEC